MQRVKASLLYFLIVLGTGFALGVVRVPFLVPRLGERNAELLATVLQSQSLSQYIASRDPVSGSVYVLLLLVFALMPALLMRVGIRRG